MVVRLSNIAMAHDCGLCMPLCAELFNWFGMDKISEGQVEAGREKYKVRCSPEQPGAFAGCLFPELSLETNLGL